MRTDLNSGKALFFPFFLLFPTFCLAASFPFLELILRRHILVFHGLRVGTAP
jgi:hypothetical protein